MLTRTGGVQVTRPMTSLALSRRALLRVSAVGAVGALLASCQTTPSSPPTVAPAASPSSAPAPALAPVQASPSLLASPSPRASAVASPSSVASAGPPPELSQVSMSYPTISGELTYINIAIAEGFFSRYGLDLQEVYAQAGNALAALLSGQVQCANADGVLTTSAFAAGSPLRLIANFDRTCPYAVFGAAGLTSPTDLAGKTIAIGEHGDASDVSAHLALKPYGLNVGTDVGLLTGGNSPARFAALLSGQVDGAVIDQESFAQQAADHGLPILVSLRDQGIPWIGGGLSVTQSFTQTAPNTILAILKGLLDGIRFFADDANRAASLSVMATQLQLQPDDPALAQAYTAYHTRSTDDPDPQQSAVDSILAALQDINPSQYSNVDGSQLIDHTFVNQLKASGFPTSLSTAS